MARFILTILACWLSAIPGAYSVGLFTRPSPFYAYDKDVELICNLNDVNPDLMTKIQELRIERKMADGNFKLVAEVHYDEKLDYTQANVTVRGYVKSPASSYLMLLWPVASPDKFGIYRCQAVGESAKGGLTILKSIDLPASGANKDIQHLFGLYRQGNELIQSKLQTTANEVKALDKSLQELAKHTSDGTKRVMRQNTQIQRHIESVVIRKLSSLDARMTRLEEMVESLVNRTANATVF